MFDNVNTIGSYIGFYHASCLVLLAGGIAPAIPVESLVTVTGLAQLYNGVLNEWTQCNSIVIGCARPACCLLLR